MYIRLLFITIAGLTSYLYVSNIHKYVSHLKSSRNGMVEQYHLQSIFN